MAKLVMQSGTSAGTEYHLHEEKIVLGRDLSGAVHEPPWRIGQHTAETVVAEESVKVLCCILPHIQHDGLFAVVLPVEQ